MTRRHTPTPEAIVKAEMIVRYRSVKTGRFVKLTREQLLGSIPRRTS